MRHQAPIPTFFTRLLCQLTPTAVCVTFWQGPFQTPPLLPGLTARSGNCLPEKEKGNKLVLFGFCVLYLSSFLMQFPITLLQSSGKLLEAYLVVHLVNGQYGAGDTWFSFQDFYFLDVCQEGEREWWTKRQALPERAWDWCQELLWKPRAPFLWGDGSFSISIFDETLASFSEMKYFCHHVYCPSQEPN